MVLSSWWKKSPHGPGNPMDPELQDSTGDDQPSCSPEEWEEELRDKITLVKSEQVNLHSLAAALKTNSILRVLRLSEINIDLAACKALAKCLETNSTLVELTLSTNEMERNASGLLAASLRRNSTLESLDLSGNQLNSTDALELAQSLKWNCSLKKLILYNNSIDSAGAQVLAEGLKENHALQILSLSKNSIGPDGVKSLADALKLNFSLCELYLASNRTIDSNTVQALKGALQVNHVLTCLDLSQNDVSPNDEQSLTALLERNRTISMNNESHDEFSQNHEVFMKLCKRMLLKKGNLHASLQKFQSHCSEWTSLKEMRKLPSSNEEFESEFPSTFSSVLSLMGVSSVDAGVLSTLRTIASIGPIAQELVRYLPNMTELHEWNRAHDQCSNLRTQVKILHRKLDESEDELEDISHRYKTETKKLTLTPTQSKKAEEQLKILKLEISKLRHSFDESLQKLTEYPKDVHEHYLNEVQSIVVHNSDSTKDDPIAKLKRKLIQSGKLFQRDYSRDYSNRTALELNGSVMKALNVHDCNEEVILKRLPFNTSPQQDMAWNELNHLLTLQNRPYVIELNGAFIQETPYGHDLILEMPYCPNGNLMHWLKKQKYDITQIYSARAIRGMETKQTAHDILLKFLSISKAVGEIHSLGIEHRDLKPENILIEGTGSLARVKLIDFGIGKDSNISFSTSMKTVNGTNIQMTTRYAPPERKHSSPDTNNDDSIREGSWDMYSLGVILYEMLCAPKDVGCIDTLSETDDPGVLPSQSGLLDKWSFKLVKSLLARNPDSRLSASELCMLLEQKISDTHAENQRKIERHRHEARLGLLHSVYASLEHQLIEHFTVNRSNLVADTLDYFEKISSRENLLQNHMAHVEGESGVGSGVFRDLCAQITNQLQDNGEHSADDDAAVELLESDSSKGWEFYSPVDSRDVGKEMEALGRLVFYCVARNYTLPLRLSPLVYCALVDQVPTTASGWLDILRAYDSSVWGIESYLQSSTSDREMAIAQVEGKKKALMGRENRMNNIQSFCRGFTSCMTAAEKEKLSNLSWRDAKLLCSGNEVIYPKTVLQAMEESLSGSRWSETSAHRQTASWFNEWILSQDSDGLRVFLGFVTGLNSLPVNLRGYRIKVIPGDSYVSAATCFKEIRIGIGCESREDFFSMMDQVMENYDIDGQKQLEDDEGDAV